MIKETPMTDTLPSLKSFTSTLDMAIDYVKDELETFLEDATDDSDMIDAVRRLRYLRVLNHFCTKFNAVPTRNQAMNRGVPLRLYDEMHTMATDMDKWDNE